MDVVLDLSVKLFKNPVVIVLGVFFAAICIVLILRFIYSFRFEGEPLMAHLDDEILLLENKLSEVISLLSIETKEDKKEKLNKEYLELINSLREVKLKRES